MAITAALIVAAGAAASAGVSAASSSSAGSASAAAGASASKSYKAAAKQASGTIKKGMQSALSYLDPWKDKLTDTTGVLQQTIGSNMAVLPQAEQLGAQVDKFNQAELNKMLGKVLPGFQQGVQQAQNNTLSMLAGQLPADVAQQISRQSAQSALQGGFSGSETADATAARNLGLTSLNLMQQGANSEQSWIQTARTQLMPQLFNPTTMFTTPTQTFQQLLSGAQIAGQEATLVNNDYLARAQVIQGGANTATNAMLGGQLAQIKADQASSQAIAQGIQGVTGAVGGMYMPTTTGGGAGAGGGGIFSMFGGGASTAGAGAKPAGYQGWSTGPQNGTYYVPSTAAA